MINKIFDENKLLLIQNLNRDDFSFNFINRPILLKL